MTGQKQERAVDWDDVLIAIQTVRQGLQLVDAGLELLAAKLGAETPPAMAEVSGFEAPVDIEEEEDEPWYLQHVRETPLYYAEGYGNGTIGRVDDILSDPVWELIMVSNITGEMISLDTVLAVYRAMTLVADGAGSIYVCAEDERQMVSW